MVCAILMAVAEYTVLVILVRKEIIMLIMYVGSIPLVATVSVPLFFLVGASVVVELPAMISDMASETPLIDSILSTSRLFFA